MEASRFNEWLSIALSYRETTVKTRKVWNSLLFLDLKVTHSQGVP